MNGLLQDVRYAQRQLMKNPGFAAVAIVTLALGIGANSAIFTLLDQALLRPLPVEDADRLVVLRFSGSDRGHIHSRSDESHYFSYPMYKDLRDRNSVLSGLLATSWTQVGLQWRNQPELTAAELVSGNYFQVLGVQPAAGRLFVESDASVDGANPVVVLSFNYWTRRFAADPRIVGESVSVNGHPFTVIGIAQRNFHSAVMGDTPGIFIPMSMQAIAMPGGDHLEDRRSRWLNMLGKLKPGITREQAESGMAPLWYAIRSDELQQIGQSTDHFRESFLTKSHLSLEEGSRGFSPLRVDVQTPLMIVMAMVGLVALMACANIGSLLLVRAAGRVREMSVRYALGARRTRVARQLLVEGLLLGLAGGTLGILLAPQASAVLIRNAWGSSGAEMPFTSGVDVRILIFNFLLAVTVSVFFSLAPAVQFWRPDVSGALKQQLVTASGSLRFRRLSVAIQIGVSVLLLVGAGLFVRTLRSLRAVNVGFATDHLVTFIVDPSLAGYSGAEGLQLQEKILETLREQPGIRSVAATDDPELADDNIGHNVVIAGYTAKEEENMNVEAEKVSPGYFTGMGMTLLAGREISDQDRMGTQKVAVVNESFARHFFGDPSNTIGRYFAFGVGDVKANIEIVGIVKDAKHTGMREEILRTVFTPYLQYDKAQGAAFYVRTSQPPEAAISTIRQAMQTLDSRLAIDNLRTMQNQIDENLTTERIVAILATTFGALAVFMAVVGLYGVLAYSTAQRTREIGIRIALGAQRGSVARMVLTETLRLTGLSIAVALPVSLLLARAVRSQLFGVSSSDPLSIAVAILLISAVAAAAALIPARRAAKVDPMVALRYE